MTLRHDLKLSVAAFRGPYAFLSNFYESPFSLPEMENEYGRFLEVIGAPTVEHAYQAYKACTLSDAMRILMAKTPADAKRIGKSVAMRLSWAGCKEQVMLMCLRAKFTQNEHLKKKLLATGDKILIEGNGWGDRYWGVCNGRGQNRLGILLMQVREELS